jgi:hypothetical protein
MDAVDTIARAAPLEKDACAYYMELFRPEMQARRRLATEPEVRTRFERMLAALDTLPGKLKFEILRLSQYSRHFLWRRPEEMPPELKRALGLDESAALSFCEFVFRCER